MRTMRLLLLSALFLITALLRGCPEALSPGVVRTADLVYGQGNVSRASAPGTYTMVDLKFDRIELDNADRNRPAVLMIHGGSFEKGRKEDDNLVHQADALALAGYVCFLIDYRLKADGPPAPADWVPDTSKFVFDAMEIRAAVHAAFVDAKTAMRYIRANATELRVDPDRIALWGESAGAFAALAAGITDDTLFSSDGPDFPVPAVNNPGVSTRPQAIIDCWGSAAPVVKSFDPTDPPIMIFHGANDFTVGLSLAPALEIRDACNANNIPVAYYPIPDAGHGAWEGIFEGKDLATLTIEFLTEHLGTASAKPAA